MLSQDGQALPSSARVSASMHRAMDSASPDPGAAETSTVDHIRHTNAELETSPGAAYRRRSSTSPVNSSRIVSRFWADTASPRADIWGLPRRGSNTPEVGGTPPSRDIL